MTVWQLEWRLALRRRRTFAFNIAVPLALVIPVALSGAPAAHAAAVYTILFVFFGTFGAAIPLVRDADLGLLGRLVLTGLHPVRFVAERTLANTLLDAVQLAPALLVIAVAGGLAPVRAAAAAAALLAALLAANALGALLAAVARSIAEAALFAAVVALFLLHASGVFRAPTPGGLAARIEAFSPFHYLHQAMLEATGGFVRTPWAASVPAASAAALALAALTAAAGPWILRRLAR